MASKIIPAGVEIESLEMRWRSLGTPGVGVPWSPGALAARASAGSVESQQGDRLAVTEKMETDFQVRLKSACEESYRRGEADGRSKARADLDNEFHALAKALEGLAGYKPRLRYEAEKDVVELAVAIARRILRRQLAIDPEVLLGLVKAALESVSAREVTELRIHPSFEALVRRHLENLGPHEAIRVVPDPGLEPGGVVVETIRGNVDSSLETQLDEVARGLADVLAVSRRRE